MESLGRSSDERPTVLQDLESALLGTARAIRDSERTGRCLARRECPLLGDRSTRPYVSDGSRVPVGVVAQRTFA